jgi:hypothetical protein
MTSPIYRRLINPIGYGWCEASKQLCVFDHDYAVTCNDHPATCARMTQPRFIRQKDREGFDAKKAVEADKEASNNLDPASHQ